MSGFNSGFRYMLGKEAIIKTDLAHSVQQYFLAFAYEPIITPIISSLYKTQKDNQIVIMDQGSGNFLSVSDDITKDVIRLVTSHDFYIDDIRRLTYCRDIIKVNYDNQSRQLTQSGIEVLGNVTAVHSLEIIYLLSNIITDYANEQEIVLEFNFLAFVNHTLQDLDLTAEQDIYLRKMMNIRFRDKILDISDGKLNYLFDININNLDKLYQIAENSNISGLIDDFIWVVRTIRERFKNLRIIFDFCEQQDIDYQYGFNFYLHGSNNVVASGGLYKISKNNNYISATGGTIYLDYIMDSVSIDNPSKPKISISVNTTQDEIKRLIKQGNSIEFVY